MTNAEKANLIDLLAQHILAPLIGILPKNFFEYVMMPWKAFPTDSKLHVQELLLIEKLQPKLNYPFISRLIFAAGKFPRASKVPPISSLQPHHKLRKKLRVRLRLNPGQWFLNTVPQKPSTARQFIYDLTSTTRNQLTAWRRLRSPEINSTQLLFFVRLAATAEARIKFKALRLLYKEMQRRNMAKPKNKRPLTIPFLAHSEFGYSLKKWLTGVIIQHKHGAVEFHGPSTKICCKSSQTVAEAVSNMKYFIRQWSLQPPTTCTCTSFLEQYPTCRTTRGHVASAMSSLQLPGQLHQLVTFSANSQIYFGRQKYLQITQDLVQQWLRHHHLEKRRRRSLATIYPPRMAKAFDCCQIWCLVETHQRHPTKKPKVLSCIVLITDLLKLGFFVHYFITSSLWRLFRTRPPTLHYASHL